MNDDKLKTGRTPVHLMNSAKRLRGREAIWVKIRELKTFTLRDLWLDTDISPGTIRTFVIALEKAGFLSSEKKTRRSTPPYYEFTLIKDVGIDCPKVRKDGSTVKPTNTENMWNAMRIMKRFSIKDLILNASTDDTKIKPTSADDYCKHLCKAGYLVKQKDKTYRFIESRYTGPKPPMIQRIKQVFDPNIGEVVYPKEDK